jgi:hypothetical protein
MTLHKLAAGVVLGLVLTLNACSRERQTEMRSMTPTHVAQINLAPSRYGELVAKLDVEMKAIGLSRYGAGPGLKELKGREVLFFDYRYKLSDKWTFLDGTDIIKHGRVDIGVYSQYFTDEKVKQDAMSRVQKVLAEYGAALKERPADAEKKPSK